MSREDELFLAASSAAHRAAARITAEIGPRALPVGRESYLATAEQIAREEIGPDWEFRISMDVGGNPYVFITRYNPPLHDRDPEFRHNV